MPSQLIDVLGLYHTDRDTPSDIFIKRRLTDKTALANCIGNAIVTRFEIKRGEGIPRYRPGYRIEAIAPPALRALAAEKLGIEAVEPEAILVAMRAGEEIVVHEFSDMRPQKLPVDPFGDGETFFRSA